MWMRTVNFDRSFEWLNVRAVQRTPFWDATDPGFTAPAVAVWLMPTRHESAKKILAYVFKKDTMRFPLLPNLSWRTLLPHMSSNGSLWKRSKTPPSYLSSFDLFDYDLDKK